MIVNHTIWQAQDENDTVRLARTLAGWAAPETLLALDGELGAGKTRFSQAYAEALGVQTIVNSPTFTIIKEYQGKQWPLYHMDVYRLSLAEADELGLDEYFYGDGVTIVEWASLIEPLLPPERLELRILHVEDGGRRIEVTGRGTRYAEWCAQLEEMGAGQA